MHRFFLSIFRLFLSAPGLLILATLDSTIIFFLPIAIDTAVIIMSARRHNWWLFPLLAAAGSMIGLTVTFLMGAKIGEKGLRRWVANRKLDKIRSKIGKSGAVALGVTALLPPPFPLSPVVLTSGALGLDKRKFLASLAVMRVARFTAEGVLAFMYGRHILRWIESVAFEYAISVLMLLAVAGTIISIARTFRPAE
jgi:membrane protein YqaA with SNARE-associated domain